LKNLKKKGDFVLQQGTEEKRANNIKLIGLNCFRIVSDGGVLWKVCKNKGSICNRDFLD
jgi:hypothetical protein